MIQLCKVLSLFYRGEPEKALPMLEEIVDNENVPSANILTALVAEFFEKNDVESCERGQLFLPCLNFFLIYRTRYNQIRLRDKSWRGPRSRCQTFTWSWFEKCMIEPLQLVTNRYPFMVSRSIFGYLLSGS